MSESVNLSASVEEQVQAANESGRTPVVFIHGLWLLPSSWDRWAGVFAEAGYAPVSPGWPDDPATVEEANAHPEVFAGKTVGQVADAYAEVIGKLERKPAVIGHSFGGLPTMIVAGRGLAAASVAIDPAPFRGVLPLPFSALKASAPVLGNPRNRHGAIPLTFDLRGAGVRRAALPGRDGEPQPLDRGQGRLPQPGAGTAAGDRRRRGQHLAARHQRRDLQAAEGEPEPDGVRRDPEPRALHHHRLRLREVCDTALTFISRHTG